MDIQRPNPYGSLREERLIAFEQSHGLRLPAAFRAFLLQFNGGTPSPSFFWITQGSDGSVVDKFYGLHDGPPHLNIETYLGLEELQLPSTMLAFADDGIGNILCLGIAAENTGQVFFLDHELHPFDKSDTTTGITKIADSFGDFLGALQEHPYDERAA
jgi:hypothetical protein